jgi:hypothetical protein
VIIALDPSSRSSYPRQYSSPRQQATGSPFDWTHTNFGNRGAYQRRSSSNESDW